MDANVMRRASTTRLALNANPVDLKPVPSATKLAKSASASSIFRYFRACT
jgi:hypothetical protein